MDVSQHAIAGKVSWVITLSPFALLPLIWQIYVYCKPADLPSFGEAVNQYKDGIMADALHYHLELPKEFISEHSDLNQFAETEIAEVSSMHDARKLITTSPIFSKSPRSLLDKIAGGIPNDSDDVNYWRCSPGIEYTEHQNGTSIVIGYEYDMLLQKLSNHKYAFIFVIVGADFISKEHDLSYLTNREGVSCNGESEPAHIPVRIERHQFETFVAYQFEQHVVKVTIPKLQSIDSHTP